jgi:hypothetical protein
MTLTRVIKFNRKSGVAQGSDLRFLSSKLVVVISFAHTRVVAALCRNRRSLHYATLRSG